MANVSLVTVLKSWKRTSQQAELTIFIIRSPQPG
jgi:hypothetical protein